MADRLIDFSIEVSWRKRVAHRLRVWWCKMRRHRPYPLGGTCVVCLGRATARQIRRMYREL